MATPKRNRRSKSVSTEKKHEPIEVEVRFTLAKPPPPPFIGPPPLPQPAKKTDGDQKPPLIFRI